MSRTLSSSVKLKHPLPILIAGYTRYIRQTFKLPAIKEELILNLNGQVLQAIEMINCGRFVIPKTMIDGNCQNEENFR